MKISIEFELTHLNLATYTNDGTGAICGEVKDVFEMIARKVGRDLLEGITEIDYFVDNSTGGISGSLRVADVDAE